MSDPMKHVPAHPESECLATLYKTILLFNFVAVFLLCKHSLIMLNLPIMTVGIYCVCNVVET